MKAVKIDSKEKTITDIDVNGLPDLQAIVGGLIATALIFPNGDTLFVDDEGLFKNPENFFEHSDGYQPFAGNGVLVGTHPKNGEVLGVLTTAEQLTPKITFLDRLDVLNGLVPV